MLFFQSKKNRVSTLLLCFALTIAIALIGIPNIRNTSVFYISQSGLYNGYLSQTNIVECSLDADNASSYNITLNLRNSSGREIAQSSQQVSANGTAHFVLNNLADINNTYGSYNVETLVPETERSANLHCQTLFYNFRPSGSDKAINYVYALAGENRNRGNTAGIFNSMDPQGLNVPVFNWLTIYNTSDEPFVSDLEIYSLKGRLVKTERIGPIKAGVRRDFPLGHSFISETLRDPLEQQNIGIYKLKPRDQDQEYNAFVTRYGRDQNQRFNFAFPLLAKSGGCNFEPLAASTFGPALNWGEIANLSERTVELIAEVTYKDRSGLKTSSLRLSLNPYSQYHVPLHQYLGQDNVGSFQVRCLNPEDKILVQSLFYGQKSTTDRTLEWAYASQASGVFGKENEDLVTLYNTFGSYNWLKLFDTDSSASDYDLEFFLNNGSLVSSDFSKVSVRGSKDIPTHQVVGQNSVGEIKIKGSSSFSASPIRVFPKIDGSIGYITSTPVFKSTRETESQEDSQPTETPLPIQLDNCPLDPNKIEPGICGCGVVDKDTDADGVFDCDEEEPTAIAILPAEAPVPTETFTLPIDEIVDRCPSDPNKLEAGDCGCGVEDVDANNNGTADCNEIASRPPPPPRPTPTPLEPEIPTFMTPPPTPAPSITDTATPSSIPSQSLTITSPSPSASPSTSPEICLADPSVRNISQENGNQVTIQIDRIGRKKGVIAPFYSRERIEADCSNLNFEDLKDEFIDSPADENWSHSFTSECNGSWIGACFIPCKGGDCGPGDDRDIYLLRQEEARCFRGYRLIHYRTVARRDAQVGSINFPYTFNYGACSEVEKIPSYDCHRVPTNTLGMRLSIASNVEEFDHWEEDCTGTEPRCDILRTDIDRRYTAVFDIVKEKKFLLHYKVVNEGITQGSVSIREAGEACDSSERISGYQCFKYTENSPVVITPSEEPSAWEEDCHDYETTENCGFIMYEDKRVIVKFFTPEPPKYLLHYRVINHGTPLGGISISPSGDTCNPTETISGYQCKKHPNPTSINISPSLEPSAWGEACIGTPLNSNCSLDLDRDHNNLRVTVEFPNVPEVKLHTKAINTKGANGYVGINIVSGRTLGLCIPKAGYEMCQRFERGAQVTLVATGDDASKARNDFIRAGGWSPSDACAARGTHQLCDLTLTQDETAATANFEGTDDVFFYLYTKAVNSNGAQGRVDIQASGGQSCPSKSGFSCKKFTSTVDVTLVATGSNASKARNDFIRAGGWSQGSEDACRARGTRQLCYLTLTQKETYATARFKGTGTIAPYCGDGACNNGESCSTCVNDCGQCQAPPPSNPVHVPSCGNGFTEADESCLSCPQDIFCPPGTACRGGYACESTGTNIPIPTPVQSPSTGPTLNPGPSATATPGTCQRVNGPYTTTGGRCYCVYKNVNACDDPRFITTADCTAANTCPN